MYLNHEIFMNMPSLNSMNTQFIHLLMEIHDSLANAICVCVRMPSLLFIPHVSNYNIVYNKQEKERAE